MYIQIKHKKVRLDWFGIWTVSRVSRVGACGLEGGFEGGLCGEFGSGVAGILRVFGVLLI